MIDSHTAPPAAVIVIDVGEDGRLHLHSSCRGAFDSSYCDRSDAVLGKIPTLLAELRSQIALSQVA